MTNTSIFPTLFQWLPSIHHAYCRAPYWALMKACREYAALCFTFESTYSLATSMYSLAMELSVSHLLPIMVLFRRAIGRMRLFWAQLLCQIKDSKRFKVFPGY